MAFRKAPYSCNSMGSYFRCFDPQKNAFDVDNRVIWVLDKVVIQKGQRYQIGGVKSILTNHNSSAWGLGIKNTLLSLNQQITYVDICGIM